MTFDLFCENYLNYPTVVKIASGVSESVLDLPDNPTPTPVGPKSNEIWYVTTDGNIVTPGNISALPTIISNIYEKDKGIITFDQELTSIGSRAFKGCKTLLLIILPDTVNSTGSMSFNGCSNLVSINIPKNITEISGNMFGGCSSLEKIELNNVESIGGSAFNGCIKLSSILLPSSILSIGSSTFYGCTSLTSIEIPNSVTSIGGGAFANCSGLTSVTIEAEIPPTLGSGAFGGTNDCPIYVPAESINVYKSAENWSTYASRIQAIK